MIDKLNYYGKNKIPVIFIIDFEIKKPIIIPINNIDKEEILFSINNLSNYSSPGRLNKTVYFKKKPIDFKRYEKAFSYVQEELLKGNSFLVNLTFPTLIDTNLTLKEIFYYSNAKYKLLYKKKFVCFSPEIFVKIEGNIISTYPMKGTIDASVPDAEKIILQDEKEFAEHITVVDLLRNDLGIVSKSVNVEKFRYIDKLVTNEKNLLQVSSKITGELDCGWYNKLGSIIFSLLPAGSITGAPKKKTVEIIKKAEGYKRGYYTGIFGYFDGNNLDSCVMIRFIENIDNRLFFKSGGGITIYSDPQKEYQELADKVYVPIG